MDESKRIKLFMVLNYASSISIVFFNKLAYQGGFPSITLTLIHFVVTALGLQICASVGMFQPASISFTSVLPLALAFCAFVVLSNLSLTYNTVGFYQLAKVMTTPTIVLLQRVFYGVSFPTPILVSLGIVCFGVALATNADVTVNFWGLIFAVSGVLGASLYQIWVKTMQKNLSSFQLLHYQAPLSALLLLPVVLIFEFPFGEEGWLSTALPMRIWASAIMSAVLAFLVNLSIFLVIGRTSPITYNVLGHFKLCSVLAGGFFLFGDPLNSSQAVGVVLTLVGIFWYTYVKLQQAPTPAAEPKASPLPTSQNGTTSEK